jgi:RHS repeat-associated protein
MGRHRHGSVHRYSVRQGRMAVEWSVARQAVAFGPRSRLYAVALVLLAAFLVQAFVASSGAKAIALPPDQAVYELPGDISAVKWTWYPASIFNSGYRAGYPYFVPKTDAWVMDYRFRLGGYSSTWMDLSPCPTSGPSWWWPSICAEGYMADERARNNGARALLGPGSPLPGLATPQGICGGKNDIYFMCWMRWYPIGDPFESREQTYGGCGAGVHAVSASECLSDPVNTATGSFVTQATDVELPGIGLPFRLTRRYTSEDKTVGALGVGWTHSYAPSLTFDVDGNVSLRGEDGQRVGFARQVNGSYLSNPGARSRLSKLADMYELVRHDQVRYRFDFQGRLTLLRDRNGNSVSLAYDSNGALATVTDTAGRVITFTHADGLLTRVELPDGRFVAYGYTNGRLTSVTDLRGNTTTYTYDGGGRLATIVDQNNHTAIRNVYGADGRVSEQFDARNNRSTFAWDEATQTATMTDARGKQWKDVYKLNVLVKRIDPLGNETQFGYDDDLNVDAITDPRGKTTTMSYDLRGNLLTRTAPAPLSYTESFTYDTQNNPLTATNKRGYVTTNTYDAAGNLITIAQPPNAETITRFGRAADGSGLLTSVTDPRNKTNTFEYDADGNRTRVTTPLGHVTTFAYDGSGRMTSTVEARGNVSGANPDDYRTSFTYNNADQPLTVTDPLGNQTALTYDPVGNLSKRTDAKNRDTSFEYDAADHLVKVIAPDLTETRYAYDPAGNLTSRTDAKNHATTYEYDDANRRTSVTSPTGQKWTYGYDPNGNLAELVDARGNSTPTDPGDGKTLFVYDELNRLASIDYSDATPDVGFSYDANGNRTELRDGFGTQTYVYDALDRLTSVTRGSDQFQYGYDAGSNVVRRIHPDGTQVDYGYDDDGRLASVTSGGATTGYGYDAAGRMASTTLPSSNGHVETRTYDRAGRLGEVRNAKDGTDLSRFSYTRDAVGNPLTLTTLDGVTSYGYDALDRLTEVCYQASCPGANDPFIRYAYDSVGNRTSEVRPSGTTTYTHNDADQLLTTTGPGGTTGYAHDANGNLTAAGARTFVYDLANRTTSTSASGTTTSYRYDGDGNRLEASIGADTTRYLWDGNFGLPQLALERDGSGGLLRRYLHGADLVSMRSGGSDFYYHHDGIGSVANVTSATGAAQWTYSYEPFGTARTETQNDPAAPANVVRFAGELADTGTGLYHLRARQYDPALGRFLATDPLAQPLSEPYLSAYAYADNKPGVLIDPSGLDGDEPDYDCGSFLSFSCMKSWFIEEEIGWNGDCLRSTSCLLGVEFNVITMVWPGGRLAREADDVGRYLARKAPHQVTPGTRTLDGVSIDDLGRVQPWTAHYDDYGRLIARTDRNAGNAAAGIPDVHHHTYEYGPGYGNRGRETAHIPGEYQP